MSSHAQTVPVYGSRREIPNVQFSGRTWRKPQLHPRDGRSEITIECPELRWPVRFYFVPWIDDDAGTRGYEYLEHTIVAPINRDTAADVDVEQLSRVTRLLQNNVHRYSYIAQLALVGRVDDARRAWLAMTRRPKRGKPLSDVFLAAIVAERRSYNGARGAITEMAAAHDVDRRTIWYWLEQAKRRGL